MKGRALGSEKNDGARECVVKERNTDHWHGGETFRVGYFIAPAEVRMANDLQCQETSCCAQLAQEQEWL